MTGRRDYVSGGGDANFFTLHASSSSPFLGSRSIMSFEDISKPNSRSIISQLYENREENIIDDDELEDYYLCYQNPEKKRRLSIEQVKFLEKCFEEENKLGPDRKIQLAKDLGLQPRQVAIWFQNRRARWKAKQLEKDYLALKASYESLKADYDSLLNEKDKLNTEIIFLTDKLLLKEKEKQTIYSDSSNQNTKSSELQQPPPEIPTTESVSDGEVWKPPANQEGIVFYSSKIDSADSYSGVRQKAACDSSYIFESKLSQEEDEGFISKTIFPPYDDVLPKLDDTNYFSDHQPLPPVDISCSLGVYVEEHAFWSWSY